MQKPPETLSEEDRDLKMMNKIILPNSYNFGESVAQLVKLSNRGLRGNDLQSFIKRAGVGMADAMQKLSFEDGEIPIHLIALGATENYGSNRNGDGFSEACCRNYHDTFVKHARWFHNHSNRDTEKSYGIVKYSSYNENMHRIELIVGLNGTKEAARKNKGLLADEEIDDLENNKEMATSMACKVAYDVCSQCGNKAKTRADYCTGVDEGGSCPGGGCKNNLSKVAEDGSVTFVDNPHPTWFDISRVFRPADRIAYVFGAMKKAASGRVIGGAELAEQIGLTTPIDFALTNITDRKVREQIKIAHELATIEQDLTSGLIKQSYTIPTTKNSVNDINQYHEDPKRVPSVLKALAREKIALSLTDFIQLASGHTKSAATDIAEKIKPYTHSLFIRLCNDSEKLASALSNNPFICSDKEPLSEHKYWATKQASSGSLDIKAVQHRAWQHAINEESISLDFKKPLQISNQAYEGLAQAYGLYKIAFLHEIKDIDPNFNITMDLVVKQNYIR